MSSKKWFVAFVISFFITIGAYATVNIFVDPFGVFGDYILDWYSYEMTKNPKVAKISYLDKYKNNYDSYVVGVTNTSSLPVEELNKYFNANFYNTFFYGQDTYDIEKMCEHLLNNCEVKNLIVDVFIANMSEYNVEIHELYDNFHAKVEKENLSDFYKKYAFLDLNYAGDKLNALREDTYLPKGTDVFDAKTGSYDKKARDVEPINSAKEYSEKYFGFDYYYNVESKMSEIDNVINSVKRIKEMCEEKDVNVIFISSPVYYKRLNNYSENDMKEFFTKLAKTTDFWSFIKSSVSSEPRYFYDEHHIRNSVGKMMAARITGADDIYIPDDFGTYVTKDNVNDFLNDLCAEPIYPDTSEYVSKVPILMYHSIRDESGDSTVVSKSAFRNQMIAIKNAGFNTVTVEDLVNYVEKGIDLPKNPICITFDDGYLDNYTNAYPILKQYNMKATIFVVGALAGNEGQYKNTGNPCSEHFSYEQAKEMADSGLISIQSHTYDMHQIPELEAKVARENILAIDGESEEEYINALREDIKKSIRQIKDHVGTEAVAVAYPSGVYSTLSNVMLAKEGIKATFIGGEEINEIVKGLPQSLFALRRYDITENVNMSGLLAQIRKNNNLSTVNIPVVNVQESNDEIVENAENNNTEQVEDVNTETTQNINEEIINANQEIVNTNQEIVQPVEAVIESDTAQEQNLDVTQNNI